MSTPIAIIAGAGRFPFYVAHEAKRQGHHVVAFGIRGWADPSLSGHVDAFEEIAVGELSRLIERLKAQGVGEAVMAGKVTKEVLLDPRIVFDPAARDILGQVKEFSVPGLLGAIGQRLAREGITLLDSSAFLKASVCPEGVLSSRPPTANEREDIELGVRVARLLAALDVGQTVVVKGRVVIAVEALEGTDAAIRRAHELAGTGLIVVKTASPTQDRRFDLPVIGTETLATLREAAASCLALEAGSSLLLDRDRLIAEANAAGMCLLGVPIPHAS